MTSTGSIRLLISDDHPIVREGLKHVISQARDIRVVGEAEDAPSTIELCRTVEADVLLLDVSMPGPGILEVIPMIKSVRPKLRILVLSVHPEQQYAQRVLKAGADGYVTKNHSSKALDSAIRQVYAGRKYVTQSLAEQLALDLSQRGRGQSHETLSNREYQVFLLLASGMRADQVGEQLGITPKTVRTYRARICEKMNFSTTAQLIFYAIQRSLVTDPHSGPVHRAALD
jgi:two-component system, NarL family, invasion response regulator UvrY